jgi:FAD/FMN-containing dehydrogenase
MTDLIEQTLYRLDEQLPGCVSKPGDVGYAAATAIWSKPIGRMPRAVVHCRIAQDVQAAIRAGRDADLPLSVRGGGHDWAGRALCEGIVIDLSGMNGVIVDAGSHIARIAGGARAVDVATATDLLDLAPVTGSVGMVGMAGLTLGGGYGPLIGRFGLALDNLVGADVVLADGRIVIADADHDDGLLWALRGGGGNFGVVTAMGQRVYELPSVQFGVFVYPFAEAKSVLERFAALMATVPDELTAQVVLAAGPDGLPAIMVAPMWCGPREQGEARLAPFPKLGTLVAGGAKAMSYGTSLSAFDAFIVTGQRTFIETCWLPALDGGSLDIFIEAMKAAASRGCALVTHEFKGAATRVPVEATAFGLRSEHVLVEIIAALPDRAEKRDEERHRQWAEATRDAFNALALPGGYPNLLGRNDAERAAKSFGPNAKRLADAKQQYDPDNVFRSAIPLPVNQPSRSNRTPEKRR